MKPIKIKAELDFTREEIWELRKRCRNLREAVPNSHWKRIYENLECALDHLDAATARSSEEPTETIPPQ